MEGLEGDEMSRRPLTRSEPLLNRSMVARLLIMAGVSVAATFGFYLWRLSTGVSFELVQTETFTLLALCQWFNVLNCRSARQSALNLGVFRNPWLAGGLLLGNLLHLLVVYAPPMNRIFHTVPIPLADFFLIGLLAVSSSGQRRYVSSSRVETSPTPASAEPASARARSAHSSARECDRFVLRLHCTASAGSTETSRFAAPWLRKTIDAKRRPLRTLLDKNASQPTGVDRHPDKVALVMFPLSNLPHPGVFIPTGS